MNNYFIIDDGLDKENIKKMNDDIKYLINLDTKLEILDYDLTPINQLNDGDKIILLKKSTLKIYKAAKFSHYDDKYIYLKKTKNKIVKENINQYYTFYKHVHSTKNMMRYLLNALENDTLDIN